jgi:hypothetical protein
MIYRRFTADKTKCWIGLLDELIDIYNNKTHSTIGLSPNEVDSSNETEILKNVYRKKQRLVKLTRFQLNDHVRVNLKKNIFDKSYTPNFSFEIFQIYKINRIFPEQYYIRDMNGKKINHAYYKEELLKVKYKDKFLIEKVLGKEGTKIYVKFIGLKSNHNRWIEQSELI